MPVIIWGRRRSGQNAGAGCAGTEQPSSPGPTAHRPQAQRRPPGTGWAGKKNVGPARCACSAPRTERPSRTSAPQKQKRQLGAPGVLHDAGGGSPLVGCASLSVFSLWQLPHASAKFARCLQRPALPSSSQVPAVRPQPTARTCRPARRRSSASPPH